MKKKNGFTLIELLAIIVILAIIAVITVPIILNIIENSKMGAAKDSAYGYKDSVNKWYVSKLTEDPNYVLNDGTYSVSELGATVEGKQPGSNSWVTISKTNVTDGCLQFDEYKVEITNGEVGEASVGECEGVSVFMGTYVPPVDTDTHKGIVYLDPTDLSNTCDSTNYSSVPGETKSGCMKFYIFDENENGTVDMILDHNTSLGIFWTKYTESGSYVNYKGPREALYQLYEDTKDWVGISDLTSDSNYSPAWTYRSINHTYTIDYTKHLSASNSYDYASETGAYKARFITAEELSFITGKNTTENPNNWVISTFNDDYNIGTLSRVSGGQPLYALETDQIARVESYRWLFDNLNSCQDYSWCSNNSSSLTGNSGYWTSSPGNGNDNNTYYTSMYAWDVNNTGCVMSMTVGSSAYGIRPVITVPKSVLGIN